MELVFIILAIGLVFYMNSGNGISAEKIKTIAKEIDKELTKEFEKRDNEIKQLKEELNFIKKELGLK